MTPHSEKDQELETRMDMKADAIDARTAAESELNRTLLPLTRPSIEAWESFWPLDAEQKREMAQMLASFAAMVIVHHQPNLASHHALLVALRQFLEKWPEAEKAINGSITMATIHGAPYTGPNLQVELDAMRAALQLAEEGR